MTAVCGTKRRSGFVQPEWRELSYQYSRTRASFFPNQSSSRRMAGSSRSAFISASILSCGREMGAYSRKMPSSGRTEVGAGIVSR